MYYKTRQDAINNGVKQYFTGIPCNNGHISPIHIAGGCMDCRKEYAKKYRKDNKDKIQLWHKNNHKQNYSTEKRRLIYEKNIVYELLCHAKTRAKQKKLDFNITKEDINIPNVCPVFNIPLDRRDRLHAPSLDRIDNNKGYVKGNIRVISAKANRLKNNGSIEDFEKIISYMKSILKDDTNP